MVFFAIVALLPFGLLPAGVVWANNAEPSKGEDTGNLPVSTSASAAQASNESAALANPKRVDTPPPSKTGKQPSKVTDKSVDQPTAQSHAGQPIGAQPATSLARLLPLAGGLGLVSLAQALGMGEAGAVGLLLVLLFLVLAGFGVWWLRGRTHSGAMGVGPDFAFDAPHASNSPKVHPLHQAKPYSPQNVGNDASARPWERQSMAFQASRFSDTSSNPPQESDGGWGMPKGFDAAAFLEASKANFVALQAAWDRADIPGLRAMMTDDMVDQIRTQLAERERHAPGVANVTEVVMLEARLLGVEEGDMGYMASVEFSGLIREAVSAGPNPFREVWNITRPKSGPSGWLVAGVQALQ